MKRSVSWLKRSNVPVAILPGRGEGKREHTRLYLKSQLIAYVRRHLTHRVDDDAEPRPRLSAGTRIRQTA
jgi:hypothetical protein